MELEIEVTTTLPDLFDYRLNRRYTSLSGITITMMGILVTMNALISKNLFFAAIGMLLIIVLPILEYNKLKKQVTQKHSMIKPIRYCMNQQGIECIDSDNASKSIHWNQVVKAGSTRSIFFLQLMDGETIVLPRREVMNYLGEVIGMISKNISPEKVKIKL